MDDGRRRLLWHGPLLFLLGLLAGAAVPTLTNPRLGLSAHLGGVMAGTFLAVLGLLWGDLRLSPTAAVALFWLVLFGSYGSTASLFLAGVFGTSRSTPIAGAGHTGTPWQEAMVNFGLTTTAVAMLVVCVLLMWGLRRAAPGAART